MIATHRARLPEKERKKYIKFYMSQLQEKRGTAVEYLIVVPKIVRSRPSAAGFEIFHFCRSFFVLPPRGFDPGSSMKQA